MCACVKTAYYFNGKNIISAIHCPLFDTHDNSGVESTPTFWQLVVNRQSPVQCFCIINQPPT